jgi:hypothetical protein
MKPSKLRETGRRETPEDSAPKDVSASTPAVGDPDMPDISADAIDHDTAAIDRALDEIAAGHAEGLNPEEIVKVRRTTVGLWARRGRPEGALLPLWLEAVDLLSKGRPKRGAVAEGLPRKS